MNFPQFLIIVLALAGYSKAVRSEGKKPITEIIDSMFDQYDRRLSPTKWQASELNPAPAATKVEVSAYILDVWNIDEKNHEFTVQMYLRQKWLDGRLTYAPPVGVKDINLDPDNAKKIWFPDTFIVNEKKSQRHDMTVSNELTRVSANGEVLRSTRITVTASCKMDLKWFPFDRQLCTIQFESYSSTSDDFYYAWGKKDGITKLGISEEAMGGINQNIREVKEASKVVSLDTGSYSRVTIQFSIARTSTRFLQDVYFPAIALPIIAFITMSVGALQFRVLLSTICMIGIIIFSSLLSGEMPKVSYQTALDFYVFNSSVMILNVVLVNFAMYHLLKPKSTTPTMRMRQINGGTAEDAKEILPEVEPSEDFNIGRPTFTNRFQEHLFRMCEMSKYSMPIFFLIFNILYWPIVLIASSFTGRDFLLDENHGN